MCLWLVNIIRIGTWVSQFSIVSAAATGRREIRTKKKNTLYLLLMFTKMAVFLCLFSIQFGARISSFFFSLSLSSFFYFHLAVKTFARGKFICISFSICNCTATHIYFAQKQIKRNLFYFPHIDYTIQTFLMPDIVLTDKHEHLSLYFLHL